MTFYVVIGLLGFAAILAGIIGAWRLATRPGAREEPPRQSVGVPPNCCLPEDTYEDHLQHTQPTSYGGIIQTDDEFMVEASAPAPAEWCKVERILTDSAGGQERMILYSTREGSRQWIIENDFRRKAWPYKLLSDPP